MIQAEIGGAARVEPGVGVQKPGFMIRDFTLTSSGGERIAISNFRGRSNLVVVFPGYSDAMHIFIENAAQRGSEFSSQEATIIAVVPHGSETQTVPIPHNLPVVVLYDRTHAVYQLSGAMGEADRLVPLVYLTDRFGEIVSTYIAPDHTMPPGVDELLHTLEFMNQQCPECEPPEWPR